MALGVTSQITEVGDVVRIAVAPVFLLSGVGITDDFVGGSFCRPSGALFLLILTYPGLTSGTTSCRRSGAGVGWRLAARFDRRVRIKSSDLP